MLLVFFSKLVKDIPISVRVTKDIFFSKITAISGIYCFILNSIKKQTTEIKLYESNYSNIKRIKCQ